MFYLISLIYSSSDILDRAGSYIAINNPGASNHIHNYILSGGECVNPVLSRTIKESMANLHSNTTMNPRNIYLTNLENYLVRNYNYDVAANFKEVMSYFYDHFIEKEDERTMCLGYMLYGTDGFANLGKGGTPGKFTKRGFLQIKGIRAYNIASGGSKEFITNPVAMGDFTLNSMKGSLLVYEHFIVENATNLRENGNLTFKNMANALSTIKTIKEEETSEIAGSSNTSSSENVPSNISNESAYAMALVLYKRLCDALGSNYIPGE